MKNRYFAYFSDFSHIGIDFRILIIIRIRICLEALKFHYKGVYCSPSKCGLYTTLVTYSQKLMLGGEYQTILVTTHTALCKD